MQAADAVQEPVDGSRASRRLSLAAFILLVSSLVLPWWTIDYRGPDGRSYTEDNVYALRPHEAARDVPVAASGGLTVAAGLLLMFRRAAQSWHHEPPSWRRDLWVCAAMLGAGTALAVGWPASDVAFWDAQDYEVDGLGYSLVAGPGVGWYLAALAAGLLATAAWTTRATRTRQD